MRESFFDEGIEVLRKRIQEKYPTVIYERLPLHSFAYEEDFQVALRLRPEGGPDRDLFVDVAIYDEKVPHSPYSYSEMYLEAWCESHHLISDGSLYLFHRAILAAQDQKKSPRIYNGELAIYNWIKLLRRGLLFKRKHPGDEEYINPLRQVWKAKDFWAEAFRYIAAPRPPSDHPYHHHPFAHTERVRLLRELLCVEIAVLRGMDRKRVEIELAKLQVSLDAIEAIV